MCEQGFNGEEQLVRLSQAQDPRAFAMLLHQYEHALRAYICRRVSDRNEAEDVFQDVALLAWTKIKQLRDARKIRPWLLSIAENVCRARYRDRDRQHTSMPPDRLALTADRYGRTFPSPADEGSWVELVEVLRRLPRSERELIWFFYVRDRPIAEIARAKGTPEGTIKRQLFSARYHLRHLYEKGED